MTTSEAAEADLTAPEEEILEAGELCMEELPEMELL